MMSVPILTLFNNKGGVGKTSLVYHLGWMFAALGKRIIMIDLDPQANLTAACCSEAQLETLWAVTEEIEQQGSTIYSCFEPLTDVGDVLEPSLFNVHNRLGLIPGDLRLSGLEDFLSQQWVDALGARNKARAFRVEAAFWTIAQQAARNFAADLIIADVGPNLSAINRAALIATQFVIMPLAADLFSLVGLKNTGPTLHRWREDWRQRLEGFENPPIVLPTGEMRPMGYVLMKHVERLGRPVKSYQKWAQRISSTYAEYMLNSPTVEDPDPQWLGTVKHYQSLVLMAQEARKPIFELTSADGAIGSHLHAVKKAREDFEQLATAILAKLGLSGC